MKYWPCLKSEVWFGSARFGSRDKDVWKSHVERMVAVSYTHLDVYKRQALTTLLYESENWTLTKRQASRIQAAEMRFLKHVAGYTLHDIRQ